MPGDRGGTGRGPHGKNQKGGTQREQEQGLLLSVAERLESKRENERRDPLWHEGSGTCTLICSQWQTPGS